MKNYPYLIIGGGMTAHAAVQGIREVDQSSRIGLFSIEKYQPYSRPPLTKGLWKGKPLEKIWLKHLDLKVELFLGQRITVLDAQNKQVQNEKGEIFRYDRLLLATGGKTRQFPFGDGKISYFRTLDDYKKLRSFTGQGKHFVIIGGSFIGSELAAALAMNGEKATLIYPDPGLGEHIFPDELALFLNEYYREKGVEVLPGTRVTTVDEQNGSLQVRTDRGAQIRADHVLAGIGILPNSELAESAGLTVEDGIVVNEYLQTSHPDIYAAGDVAAFYNPALGTRMRVEHEDNALTMGKLAGKNMVLAKTGDQPLPYHHLPYFYSDLFELGYEAVGELNPQYEIFSDWQEPFQKGVVYYLAKKRVRGVLLWNVWGQVEAARNLIAEPGPITARDLKAGLHLMNVGSG
jgi:3-phenylpropionate/trans-cinnamate dioxygenase ferredoxin reductase subunit